MGIDRTKEEREGGDRERSRGTGGKQGGEARKEGREGEKGRGNLAPTVIF